MCQVKFSVIIPVYNCSKTIIRALESITNQNYDDYEVILINDCSSDNSLSIIHSFCDTHSRVRIYSNTENCGPAESRNRGIAAATGQYICFLDSDDFFSNSYFQTLDHIVESEDPDIIYIGYNHLFENVSRSVSNNCYPDKDSFLAEASSALWRFVVKSDIIRKFSLPNIRNAEDIAVIPLLINSSKKISFCPSTLYNYIHSNSSLSSVHSPTVSSNFIKSFNYTLTNIGKPYSSGIEFHGIKTILYGAILNALKAGLQKKSIYDIIDNFESMFPNWNRNRFIKTLPMSKKIFLFLVRNRSILFLNLYSFAHNKILNRM